MMTHWLVWDRDARYEHTGWCRRSEGAELTGFWLVRRTLRIAARVTSWVAKYSECENLWKAKHSINTVVVAESRVTKTKTARWYFMRSTEPLPIPLTSATKKAVGNIYLGL